MVDLLKQSLQQFLIKPLEKLLEDTLEKLPGKIAWRSTKGISLRLMEKHLKVFQMAVSNVASLLAHMGCSFGSSCFYSLNRSLGVLLLLYVSSSGCHMWKSLFFFQIRRFQEILSEPSPGISPTIPSLITPGISSRISPEDLSVIQTGTFLEIASGVSSGIPQ